MEPGAMAIRIKAGLRPFLITLVWFPYLFVADLAQAQTCEPSCDCTFQGSDPQFPTSWWVRENWSCHQVPDYTQSACIPTGQTAEGGFPPFGVRQIWVASGATLRSEAGIGIASCGLNQGTINTTNLNLFAGAVFENQGQITVTGDNIIALGDGSQIANRGILRISGTSTIVSLTNASVTNYETFRIERGTVEVRSVFSEVDRSIFENRGNLVIESGASMKIVGTAWFKQSSGLIDAAPDGFGCSATISFLAGAISGRPILYEGARLEFGEGFSSQATIAIKEYRGSLTGWAEALTSIPEGVTLVVAPGQYPAFLRVHNSITNFGVIVLQDPDSMIPATNTASLNIASPTAETVLNNSGQIISLSAGSNVRNKIECTSSYACTLINNGAIQIHQPTDIGHPSSNELRIENGGEFITAGETPDFALLANVRFVNQDQGLLQIPQPGAFRLFLGTFAYQGGTISGEPLVESSNLNFSCAELGPASFELLRQISLQSDVPRATTLKVGTPMISSGLESRRTFTNNGRILLYPQESSQSSIQVYSDGSASMFNNGLIAGSGSLRGDTYVNNGLISPGSDPVHPERTIGTINVSATHFTQGTDGVLEMTIRDHGSEGYDRFTAGSEPSVDLAGTLSVVPLDGWSYDGQEYPVLSHAQRIGRFDASSGQVLDYRPRQVVITGTCDQLGLGASGQCPPVKDLFCVCLWEDGEACEGIADDWQCLTTPNCLITATHGCVSQFERGCYKLFTDSPLRNRCNNIDPRSEASVHEAIQHIQPTGSDLPFLRPGPDSSVTTYHVEMYRHSNCGHLLEALRQASRIPRRLDGVAGADRIYFQDHGCSTFGEVSTVRDEILRPGGIREIIRDESAQQGKHIRMELRGNQTRSFRYGGSWSGWDPYYLFDVGQERIETQRPITCSDVDRLYPNGGWCQPEMDRSRFQCYDPNLPEFTRCVWLTCDCSSCGSCAPVRSLPVQCQ